MDALLTTLCCHGNVEDVYPTWATGLGKKKTVLTELSHIHSHTMKGLRSAHTSLTAMVRLFSCTHLETQGLIKQFAWFRIILLVIWIQNCLVNEAYVFHLLISLCLLSSPSWSGKTGSWGWSLVIYRSSRQGPGQGLWQNRGKLRFLYLRCSLFL